MQSQRSQQLAVTSTQSLQVVQTLLRASFGCVAYLRDLLPDDNFVDGYLNASGDYSFSHSDSPIGETRNKSIPARTLHVKMIKKDFSTEGNKLIQYLEEGIFDALEKQYLRSFIFAVYLDEKDPENIVEAYTFNFSYHIVPGSTSKVPVMTLGERLEKMTLGTGYASKVDPATESILKGKPPTLGEVKKSVKTLMKTLLISMQQLHALPKRRFGTFKLFYLDHVPDDYEPPHFTTGNANNKYFFTTHTTDETPTKVSIGSLATSYHGVELHLASISDVIPGGEVPEDAAPFGGSGNTADSYSGLQVTRLEENGNSRDIQHEDALMRKVVWDAEAFANPNDDGDAEGEYDPEYQGPWNNLLTQQPKGIRRPDGTVVSLSQASADKTIALQGFPGAKIDETDNIKIMNHPATQPELSQTQIIDPAEPIAPGSQPSEMMASLARTHSHISREGQEETAISHGIETQLVRDVLELRDAEESDGSVESMQDSVMLDLETQLPIVQKSCRKDRSSTLRQSVDTSQNIMASKDGLYRENSDTDTYVTDCDCGVFEDDDHGACQCEGPCGRWLHIWCMGYHSLDDPRLPHIFHCFTCRLRNDPQIDMLNSRNLTSEYISKFKDLSLFRRALKMLEVHRPDNVTRFKELLGSEVSVAGQAWKRLEAEGFIAIQTTEMDGIGLLETQATAPSRKVKAKGKHRARKNIKRAKYGPVLEAMTGKAFQHYFEPRKEASLLGMTKPRLATAMLSQAQDQEVSNQVAEKIIESLLQSSMQADFESQTQSETQVSAEANDPAQAQPCSSKRKGSDKDVARNPKRMKVSVGAGINLED